MIVIGTDTHKQSHTAAALDEGTGRVIAEETVRAKRRSFDDLLRWGRRLDAERVWAIEDCRHVSGALERFLLARGERVVRVAPKLTAGARTAARERGKSDAIDAVAIARAAIREGVHPPPVAKLVGEIAGVQRFDSDAKLARIAGSAPVPASSGHSDRHRLDRGGNRQLNCALHRLAVTKGRLDPDTAHYLARRQADGKSRREALRCLKRHLARRVWHLLQPLTDPASALATPHTPAVTIHCNVPLNAFSCHRSN